MRGRSWAPRVSRIEAGAAFVPVSIAGSDGISFLPPRLPQIRLYYGEPIQLDDLPADDLRRASHTATKRWMAAIEAGLAKLAQVAQAARWSIRRWRCSCSQD